MAVTLYRSLQNEKQEVIRFDENLRFSIQPKFQFLSDYFDAFGIPVPEEISSSQVVYPPRNGAPQEAYRLFKTAIEYLVANKLEYRDYFWDK